MQSEALGVCEQPVNKRSKEMFDLENAHIALVHFGYEWLSEKPKDQMTSLSIILLRLFDLVGFFMLQQRISCAAGV